MEIWLSIKSLIENISWQMVVLIGLVYFRSDLSALLRHLRNVESLEIPHIAKMTMTRTIAEKEKNIAPVRELRNSKDNNLSIEEDLISYWNDFESSLRQKFHGVGDARRLLMHFYNGGYFTQKEFLSLLEIYQFQDKVSKKPISADLVEDVLLSTQFLKIMKDRVNKKWSEAEKSE